MSFPVNEDKQRRIEALVNLFMTSPRGEIIHYSTIEQVIGWRRHADRNKFWSVVNKAIERAKAPGSGVVVRNIPNVGYVIQKGSEAVKHQPRMRMRRAGRQYGKLNKEMIAIDIRDLSEHEIVVRAKIMDSLGQTQRSLRQSMQLHSALMKPPETRSSPPPSEES